MRFATILKYIVFIMVVLSIWALYEYYKNTKADRSPVGSTTTPPFTKDGLTTGESEREFTELTTRLPKTHATELATRLPKTHATELATRLPKTHATELAARLPKTHAAELAARLPKTHATELTTRLPNTHATKFIITIPNTHAIESTTRLPKTHATELTTRLPNTHATKFIITIPNTHAIESTTVPLEIDTSLELGRDCWITLMTCLGAFFLILAILCMSGCLTINYDCFVAYCGSSCHSKKCCFNPPKTEEFSLSELTLDLQGNITHRNSESGANGSSDSFPAEITESIVDVKDSRNL